MRRSSRGFTLLLAMLIVSMVLSAALGITEIIIKENQLSTLVRESEAAFHAADKGIECALFYHISYDRTPLPNASYTTLAWSPFPTSTVGTYFSYPNRDGSGDEMDLVTCTDNNVNKKLNTIWTISSTNSTQATTNFRLNFGADDSYPCADVTIANTNGGVNTTITSYGYDICDATAANRTLRVIEVTTSI